MAKKKVSPKFENNSVEKVEGSASSEKSKAKKPSFKKEVAITKKVTPAAPMKPQVPFPVYEKLSGLKPDQLAAFKNFVRRKKLKPCSVRDWKSRYQDFMKRPVG